jgi:hypothetical protein
MKKLHEVFLWLVIALFGLPAAVIATEAPPIGNQPTVTQEPAPPTTAQGDTAASGEKAGKKSNQDVESRGLFKKKKKKQKSRAAGHSQSSDSIDPSAGSAAGR